MFYDVVVVGGGINGSATAYELQNASLKVAVFDKGGIASGGSGAAGAFISPKFSKAGELKELLHKAFCYSMDFYENKFPEAFIKTQLIHVAKDEVESQVLQIYKEKTTLPLLEIPKEVLSTLNQEALSLQSGLVDAKKVCELLVKDIDLYKEEVYSLVYSDKLWHINDKVTAKNVVLATGAYKKIIDEPYIKLRGVWGHRIDIKSSTYNKYSFHQYLSIAQTHKGVTAIGATHNLKYHPETSSSTYDDEEGRVELLQKAKKMLLLEDIEILKDYTGLRSGSFDYIPLVGLIVDSKKTLQQNTNFKVKKADYNQYIYYDNLYMINGSGGYGFVLAPYLAKILKDAITKQEMVPKGLLPARFFARWAKKL